jgi:putative pyoverdin transport system ATP-binding/permease protein
MKLLKFLFRYSPKNIVFSALLGTICGFANTWVLMLINAHLKGAVTTEHEIWKYAAVCLVVMFTYFAARVSISRLTLWSAFDLRLQIARQWVNKSLYELERDGNQKLLSAITQDVEELSAIMRGLPFLCVDYAITLGCFGYLAYLSWQLLLALLAVIAMLTAVRKTQARQYERTLNEAHHHSGKLLSTFIAMERGIKELKMNRARWNAFYVGELYQTSESLRDLSFKSEVLFAVTNSFGELSYFIFAAALIYGAPLMHNISLDLIISFAFTVIYLRVPLDHVLASPMQMARAQVALNHLESLGVFEHRSSLSVDKLRQLTARKQLAVGVEADAKLTEPVPKKLETSLRFKAVEYKYEDTAGEGGFKFGPIDLTIHPRELLFITGGNGSGKTTFAKILCGLYPPNAGEIWLDDIRIQPENSNWYAQHFGTVFSDSHLFSKLYGAEDLPQTSGMVTEYLKEFKLQDKVKFDQGRFSTVALSQGQRKRLSLLVAYMEERPFYLFDEWAADQDPEFRKIFYFRLLRELKAKGKTIIVITHDDRYYHVADRVLKFEGGELWEEDVAGGLLSTEHAAVMNTAR